MYQMIQFRGNMKYKYENIRNIFLFEKMTKEEINNILWEISGKVVKYKRGDIVFSEESNENCVGFLLCGECEVRRMREGDFVVLNTLTEGDSFGIISVFAPDEEFPTRIFARKNTAVLFFTDDEIRTLIKDHPEISLSIINFLAKRVIFLNKKIATYSGGNISEKLENYLLTKYKEHGEEFPLNCKRCSEALGVGRASVYRALDSLEERGILTFVDKKIKIISHEWLERN